MGLECQKNESLMWSRERLGSRYNNKQKLRVHISNFKQKNKRAVV